MKLHNKDGLMTTLQKLHRPFGGYAVPVPKEWQDNISIDPGLNNPLAALWFAVDYDDNVYVVYEHFAAGKDIDYHAAAIGAACASLGWHTDPKGRICEIGRAHV